ncbi:hypothetical protein [Streptomyces sp. HUAS TT7]
MYDHSRDNERVIPVIPGPRKASEPITAKKPRAPRLPAQRDRRTQ